MEWRVIFRSPADKGQDRRVAIVQIADSSGLILVIQVHAMSRTFSTPSITFGTYGETLCRLSKETSGTLLSRCLYPLLNCLQELIENPKIPKLGVNIEGEGMFTS